MSRNGQSTIQQNGPTVITTNNNNGSFSSFELSEEFMNCPVCKKTFETPKLLPCLHSFCERCLQNSLQASGIQQGQAFLCPLCRNDCVLPKKGVSALPSNVFIETLQKFRTKKTGVKKANLPRMWDGCPGWGKVYWVRWLALQDLRQDASKSQGDQDSSSCIKRRAEHGWTRQSPQGPVWSIDLREACWTAQALLHRIHLPNTNMHSLQIHIGSWWSQSHSLGTTSHNRG